MSRPDLDNRGTALSESLLSIPDPARSRLRADQRRQSVARATDREGWRSVTGRISRPTGLRFSHGSLQQSQCHPVLGFESSEVISRVRTPSTHRPVLLALPEISLATISALRL